METYKTMYEPSGIVFGSYPTYEEWKLINNYDGFGGEGLVLILPMRNGNRV